MGSRARINVAVGPGRSTSGFRSRALALALCTSALLALGACRSSKQDVWSESIGDLSQLPKPSEPAIEALHALTNEHFIAAKADGRLMELVLGRVSYGPPLTISVHSTEGEGITLVRVLLDGDVASLHRAVTGKRLPEFEGDISAEFVSDVGELSEFP